MLVLNWCWISVCYHHKNWFLIVESVGSAYTENATITQGGENYYTCVTQKVSIQKTFKQTKMDLNLSAIIPPDETDEQRKKRVYARPPERFIIDQFNIGDRLRFVTSNTATQSKSGIVVEIEGSELSLSMLGNYEFCM